jgi:hydroxymethylpyrimidine kinase/phosphomethylpyrimidine kinase
MKKILTIAGSDSSGGAGIQADLKTITVLGGFGMSVLTALTAQNSRQVQAIHAVPAAFVKEQLDAVLSDMGADAAKTGMLYDASIIDAVAEGLLAHHVDKVVVDPVMVAKGGDRLLVEEAVEALMLRLIPVAHVVTPNISEAEVLAKGSIETDSDVREAARIIHGMGAKHVLIKGGHLQGAATDTLYDGHTFTEFSRDRINTRHTHGTGCVYSAAIATYLGMGFRLTEAVEMAKAFIHSAIRFAVPLGKGHGPTNIYAQFARERARYEVLEALKAALERLKEHAMGHLVPEVQTNFGYALPFAETHDDVAAFPGRLVRLKDKVVSVACPCFGASRHIAAIVLTVMGYDPDFRAAMNIRFTEGLVGKCEALGWKVASFDRASEPKDIKEKEGSTLEWGTKMILSRVKEVPDIIFDRGDIGKEPMIRVLGRNPGEVVEKVLHLAKPGV